MRRAFSRSQWARRSACDVLPGSPPTRALAHTWAPLTSQRTTERLQDGMADPWVVRRFRERTHRRAIVLADLRSPRLALGRTPAARNCTTGRKPLRDRLLAGQPNSALSLRLMRAAT